MANNQKLKDNYQESIKPFQPKPSYVANCLKAFLVGGLICTLGQAIQNFYIAFFDFNEKNAGNPTVATLILISALLTGFGIYDRIGQFAGAGSAVPVTGFANSMTSAALEHRSEGIVLGVATNMFKLAGNVIVFGTVSAYVVGIIRYLFKTYLL
ncbi:stage V sporulation protein AC [Priestia aryabhattai]|uniref:Stage V sporulation protein AC n=1 Tax=Priestia aryabhattai TaxID=412384 RepID=A0ABD7WTG0_PRIAR|nr:stage V sporulation protein AC [Priestia aryabhattai]MBX9970292.1 stage V sporulation protein AC [Priestia aryabhattai]MBY0026747.1 stage V sporulation protein AC [Priestia aryabhattai]MBZ6485678.1 stage V sporulation protein AC [Priestia aryabhattai]MDH3112654.1 stage V sporulation protein AC [Priestia aryabhattai]MDH3128434.1 stage V sporulation protein AC [Priestia aryabhattai]